MLALATRGNQEEVSCVADVQALFQLRIGVEREKHIIVINVDIYERGMGAIEHGAATSGTKSLGIAKGGMGCFFSVFVNQCLCYA